MNAAAWVLLLFLFLSVACNALLFVALMRARGRATIAAAATGLLPAPVQAAVGAGAAIAPVAANGLSLMKSAIRLLWDEARDELAENLAHQNRAAVVQTFQAPFPGVAGTGPPPVPPAGVASSAAP